MLRSGSVRNENVIGSLLSFEFERFFPDLLSRDWREETCDQDKPRDEETLSHLLFKERFDVFRWSSEHRAIAALDNRPLH